MHEVNVHNSWKIVSKCSHLASGYALPNSTRKVLVLGWLLICPFFFPFLPIRPAQTNDTINGKCVPLVFYHSHLQIFQLKLIEYINAGIDVKTAGNSTLQQLYFFE